MITACFRNTTASLFYLLINITNELNACYHSFAIVILLRAWLASGGFVVRAVHSYTYVETNGYELF
jgi:hypothetical protein